MLLMSLIWEPSALPIAMRSAAELLKLSVCLAFGVLGINVCEMGVVQWTSAVTFTVLSNLHSIPMVISGILFFDDNVAFAEVLGFSVCICGSLVYSWAKTS